jgi:hypothetical protein
MAFLLLYVYNVSMHVFLVAAIIQLLLRDASECIELFLLRETLWLVIGLLRSHWFQLVRDNREELSIFIFMVFKEQVTKTLYLIKL